MTASADNRGAAIPQRSGVPPERSTTGGLGTLLATLVLLLASALILALALWLFSPELARDRAGVSAPGVAPLKIAGKALQMRIGGQYAVAGEALKVRAMGPDKRIIATADTDFLAADYPTLEYAIDGLQPGVLTYLIWRTLEQPETIYNVPLYFVERGSTAFRLGDHPDWEGTITELGLDIYGDLGGGELLIPSLQLLPGSTAALIQAVTSQWLAKQRWSQRSINNLRGAPVEPLYPATVVVAIWVALALALACVWMRFSTVAVAVPLLPMSLIGWLALDALWAWRLDSQLTETRTLFAGKSQQAKQLADMDGVLFRYALRLKETLLPTRPGTVFVLSERLGHDYQRLRIQYHLLPHSVYNYGRVPPTAMMREGDYIVVLGEVAGLVFVDTNDRLRWEGLSLPVTRLDVSSQGVLYRVEAYPDE